MSFSQNLQALRQEFVTENALNASIGRNATNEDVFNALEQFANGQYNTVGEMLEASPFNAQNEAYRGIVTMLNNMGTPVRSLTKRKGNGGATKMEGNSFVARMLEKKGLELPTRERSES